MKISKNSSLYFLCKMGWMPPSRWEINTNLCEVFWHSLWGLVMTMMLTLCAAGVGIIVLVEPTTTLIGYFNTGVWVPNDLAIGGMIIDSAIIIAGAIFLGVDALQKHRRKDPLYYEKQEERERKRRENPGLIRSAYRSWKEKTCVLITFENKPETEA